MSTILDKLKAIKLMFSAEPTPPAPATDPTPAPVKQEAHEYQTNDGLNLMIDKLDVGGIVTKDNAPVEDNTYTLVDGTSFSTKNGVIDAMISTPTPPAPVVDEEMKKELATVKEQFAAVKLEKENFEKTLNAKLENQEKIIKEMFAALELMGEQSSQKPLEPNADWDKLSPLEKRRLAKQN
jgi:hypothetical protein